jgi:DNA-binding helix-hairpin-helix protein with protein kinase domain
LETSGVVLFRYTGTINTPSGQAEVDITILWQRISAIPSPGPAPSIVIPSSHSLTPTPLPGEAQITVQQHKTKQFFQIAIILFFGCWLLYSLVSSGHWIIGLLIGWVLWGMTEGIRQTTADFGALNKTRQKELQTAQERFNFSKGKWDKEVGDQPFISKLETLSKSYHQAKNLDQEFAKEKQRLESDRHKYQLKKFLEQEYIEHANLPGIGAGLKATLESYGYETAADLMTFQAGLVPGFGEKRVAQLIAWRQSREARFTFNPHQAVDPQDIQALKNKYDHLKATLITALNNGEQDLQNLKQEILKKRATWRPQLEAIAQEVAQKQADLRVF